MGPFEIRIDLVRFGRSDAFDVHRSPKPALAQRADREREVDESIACGHHHVGFIAVERTILDDQRGGARRNLLDLVLRAHRALGVVDDIARIVGDAEGRMVDLVVQVDQLPSGQADAAMWLARDPDTCGLRVVGDGEPQPGVVAVVLFLARA